ncbi:MAG: DUF1634 domain-containing protein [Phycisphaerae bacterium]|nr:DUF1634 domain-containing protein [Phycisphaerae bacterium]
MTEPTTETIDHKATKIPITRMEQLISSLLRGGIILSLSLVLIGVVVMFVRHPEYLHSRDTLTYLKGDNYRFPATIHALFKGVIQGQGRSIVLLGVFVLFLTPIARVIATGIAFAFEKDWAYTIITLLVLGFVLLSERLAFL